MPLELRTAIEDTKGIQFHYGDFNANSKKQPKTLKLSLEITDMVLEFDSDKSCLSVKQKGDKISVETKQK